MDFNAIVELHVDLALHHHQVVDGIGAVHAVLHTGAEIENAKHTAVLDHGELAFAHAAVLVTVVVGGHGVGGPDVANEGVLAALLEMGTNLVNLDNGLAFVVMTGHNAANLGNILHGRLL